MPAHTLLLLLLCLPHTLHPTTSPLEITPSTVVMSVLKNMCDLISISRLVESCSWCWVAMSSSSTLPSCKLSCEDRHGGVVVWWCGGVVV